MEKIRDYIGVQLVDGDYINEVKARAAELRSRVGYEAGFRITVEWVNDVIKFLGELEEA